MILLFFSSKMSVLLSIMLIFSSNVYNIFIAINTQPPWPTNLKLLMHQKSFLLFLSHFLCTKLHLFYFLSKFIQKQDFDSKLCKLHRDIKAHDFWSLRSWSFLWWCFEYKSLEYKTKNFFKIFLVIKWRQNKELFQNIFMLT